MAWLVFALLAGVVALYIALPRRDEGREEAIATAANRDELRAQRDTLLAGLRDLDEDAAAGRITAEDRRRARRALGPPLRATIERLREQGER